MIEKISIGKLRGLQQCTSEKGTFTCLALDHRQNLRKANPAFTDDVLLSQFKLETVSALADLPTTILLDPEVSAAQAISTFTLPGNRSFVVALESTGYGGSPTARQSQIIPGWNVRKAKHMGASMVKLLVYYHPDSTNAGEIGNFVHRIVKDCQEEDLGLMLEPLSYSLDPEKKLDSAEKRYVVRETAKRLVIPGVDVLKAEFPLDAREVTDERVWREACLEISAASRAPWIVLSAAIEFETYLRQVEIACQAGASGSAVGRAVWQEAIMLVGTQRKEFLRSTGRDRLGKIAATSSANGKSIQEFYSADAPFDWYKEYTA